MADVVDSFEIENYEAYSHSIIYLDPDELEATYVKAEPNIIFHGNFLTGAQVCSVNNISSHKNVLFAGPSSSGKTELTLWTAFHCIQRRVRFVFVVQDEWHRDLLYNKLRRIGCFQIVSVDQHIGPECGLIITVGKLRELIDDKAFIESVRLFIFDNIDQLQDEVNGYAWEELLVELGKATKLAQYLFTSTNFSNIEDFSRWLTIIYSAPFHLVLAKNRLFRTRLHLSIPHDRSNMQLFNENFSIDKDAFDNGMNAFITLNDYVEVNLFADRCMSSFPVRLTVRNLYTTARNWPIIVVAFNDASCKNYAWQIGQTIGLLPANKKVGVTRIMDEFKERLDTDERFLLDKLKDICLNGVAYWNRSMSKNVCSFVETLFHKEFIKVLVITEEVAINSHFRGKILVVSSCRKFDGASYRYLTNYEWQRILCLSQDRSQFVKIALISDWKIDLETLSEIVESKRFEFCSKLLNSPTPLDASIVRRSFHKFLLHRKSTILNSEIRSLSAKVSNLPDFLLEKQFKDHYEKETKCQELFRELCEESFNPTSIIPYLNCGRLIKVEDGNKDFGTAIVIRYVPPNESSKKPALYVALKITRDSIDDIHDFKLVYPAHEHENTPYGNKRLPIGLVKIVNVPLNCVKAVYTYRLRLPVDLGSNLHFLQVLLNGISAELELVKIPNDALDKVRDEYMTLKEEIEQSVLKERENFAELEKEYKGREELIQKRKHDQEFIEDYKRDPFE